MQLQLLGPFSQLLPLRNLAIHGSLKDNQLEIIKHSGIIVQNGHILDVGSFNELESKYSDQSLRISKFQEDLVVIPGLIDAHTHICFAGSRAQDFSLRNAGSSYPEIQAAGGGIWDTVVHTRKASEKELIRLTLERANRLLKSGITTVEIKSGYGLSVADELKMLRVIQEVKEQSDIDVVSTCLAAHVIPKIFMSDEKSYLELIVNELLPIVREEKLSNRFDIFIEKNAFTSNNSKSYLQKIKKMGFDITIHGDQFTTGGSQLAIDCGAISVDHLEASGMTEIQELAKSKVIAVALPGASLGLGCAFAPCRKLLDQGCSVAIASDWNPGSAPMGNLLTQASILACFEKLTTAEVLAGMTYRAAAALNINDKGQIKTGFLADFVAFPTNDYREILYNQGQMLPKYVWKSGIRLTKLE